MDITKIYLLVGAICVLLAGTFVGSYAFPQETVVEVEVPVNVTEIVEVVKEVPVEVVVEKEIKVENTTKIESLSDELSMLKARYEQITDERYVRSDVEQEFAAIQAAVSDFKELYMYKLIRAGFTPSEISVVRVFDEEVSIVEVSRSVDGIKQDYDKVDVDFQVKAKYQDEDGVEYRFWNVSVGYDLDSEGRVDTNVTAVLV